jgi:hypothetical protein
MQTLGCASAIIRRDDPADGFDSPLVVADLDRPQEGALRVSQQALIDTRESMDR